MEVNRDRISQRGLTRLWNAMGQKCSSALRFIHRMLKGLEEQRADTKLVGLAIMLAKRCGKAGC